MQQRSEEAKLVDSRVRCHAWCANGITIPPYARGKKQLIGAKPNRSRIAGTDKQIAVFQAASENKRKTVLSRSALSPLLPPYSTGTIRSPPTSRPIPNHLRLALTLIHPRAHDLPNPHPEPDRTPHHQYRNRHLHDPFLARTQAGHARTSPLTLPLHRLAQARALVGPDGALAGRADGGGRFGGEAGAGAGFEVGAEFVDFDGGGEGGGGGGGAFELFEGGAGCGVGVEGREGVGGDGVVGGGGWRGALGGGGDCDVEVFVGKR